MRPSLLLALVFVALALMATLLAGTAGWLLVRANQVADEKTLLLVDAAALVALLFALAGSWVVLQQRLARPIEAVTREIETLSHARKPRPLDIPDGHATGGLADALHDLVARLIAAREETEKAVAAATGTAETYKRRLEAILLDMSEGVIVCNLDNRVLLYNEAASRLLNRPEALGLGRRLFGLFERGPVLDALRELTERQRADTTRKLRSRRDVKCRRLDSGAVIGARIALVCSDEVETEGYVLTFSEGDEPLNEEEALPPRPEFYDFDLFRREPDREKAETPLAELRCVVFDTETTGLEPSAGDELISIGAVRVVNGRIVRGETFEQLINPGRPIPKASIRFHGITDADVKDAPYAAEVLPRFRTFAGTSTLVAHNAAFDMKFLELKQAQSGVTFDNAVLDVLLLSAFLHDHTGDHSLNAAAERLGVEVSARHSALGDAMITARIFLAMLPLLRDRGVITLGDALDVSEKMTGIRKQQAKF